MSHNAFLRLRLIHADTDILYDHPHNDSFNEKKNDHNIRYV